MEHWMLYYIYTSFVDIPSLVFYFLLKVNYYTLFKSEIFRNWVTIINIIYIYDK